MRAQIRAASRAPSITRASKVGNARMVSTVGSNIAVALRSGEFVRMLGIVVRRSMYAVQRRGLFIKDVSSQAKEAWFYFQDSWLLP